MPPSANLITTVFTPANWTGVLQPVDLFPSPGPIELDVGCGKGHFLVARAKEYPSTNFIGIDRMFKRIQLADRKFLREKLMNVRLLRAEAFYTVCHLLPPLSVSMVHISFPDPWPKRRHHRRRLFSPDFLIALHRVLLPGGQLNLATDDLPYYDAISALFSRDTRFKPLPPFNPREEERTAFERLFMRQGKPIHRCSFGKA